MNYDFKQPRPENFKTRIFTMIEQEKTEEVIEFLDSSQQQLYATQNYWTIAMYAVRYGNIKLMRYLNQRGLLTEHPQTSYSLIHATLFNNDVETLKILVDELGKDPNSYVQYQVDNNPLRYAYKNDLTKVIEFLCSRGAYYHYENLTNNMIKEGDKYQTLSKQDIPIQQIFIVKNNKSQEDKTTPFIRFMRFRNVFLLKKTITDLVSNPMEVENSKLKPFQSAFTNEHHFRELVSIVGPSKLN